MNLSLPPEIQKVIEERVRSGKYDRAEDIVSAAGVSLDQHGRAMQLSASELAAIYPQLWEKLAEGLSGRCRQYVRRRILLWPLMNDVISGVQCANLGAT